MIQLQCSSIGVTPIHEAERRLHEPLREAELSTPLCFTLNRADMSPPNRRHIHQPFQSRSKAVVTDPYDAAVAFHHRKAEREGAVPWRPAHDPDLVWPRVGVVLLHNINGTVAYAFRSTKTGALRFSDLAPVEDHERAVKLFERAEKALASGSPESAELLDELGFSAREIDMRVATSRESARQSSTAS